MSQVMKWHYKGEADITLGEIYISPLPKILAIIIISMVSLISIAGYVYRYFIYDFIIILRVSFIRQHLYSVFPPLLAWGCRSGK